MPSSLNDVSWSFVSQLSALMIAVGVQVGLAWFLGPEGRGSYAVCMVFAALLGVVFELGTDTAAMYMVASGRLTLSQTLSTSLSLVFCLGLIGAAFGEALLHLPLEFFRKADMVDFRISLLLVPLTSIYQSLMRIITGLRRFRAFALFTTLQSMMLLLVLVALVPVAGLHVSGALWAQVVSFGVASLLILRYYRVSAGAQWSPPSWSHIKPIVSYGSRLFLGKLADKLNVQVAIIVMAFYLTTEEIGLFAVALAMVARVGLIPDAVGAALVPRIAEDQVEGRAPLVAQAARVSLIVSGVALASVMIVAEPLVTILFSRDFLPLVPLARWLALGLGIRFGLKIFESYFVGTNRPGIRTVAVTAGLGVNFALLNVLVPRFGVVGAAWATVMGLWVSSGVLLLLFRRISRMSFGEIWRFQRADWALPKEALLIILGRAAGRGRARPHPRGRR